MDTKLKQNVNGLIIAVFIFLIFSNCSMSKDNELWILGFPLHEKVAVYNEAHEPIGVLDSPWLFKKSQLDQSEDLAPLSHLDLGNKYWRVDAYVQKDSITTIPPKRYQISERWTIVPLHPAQNGTHVENLMMRVLKNQIELRVSIDLQSARYYRYPK